MLRQFRYFSLLFLFIVEPCFAQEKAFYDVKTKTDLSVRTLDNGLLVDESVIPAGSIVSVPAAEFFSAGNYSFWKNGSEQNDSFVKGVQLVSAPGFSDQDVASLNESNQDQGLFLSKTYLGDSIVVSQSETRTEVKVRRPAPVLRPEGIAHTSTLAPISKSNADSLVDQIDKTNQTVRTAGSAAAFCPGCEESMYKKWVAEGVPQKALSEALEEERKNTKGLIHNKRYITIVDFTKSSDQRRMYVMDTQTGLLQKLLTTNGKGSDVGAGRAGRFGNSDSSKMTPPGFHVTGFQDARGVVHTTSGIHHSPHHGDSLLLIGLEDKNCNSAERKILIHSADYANEDFVRRYGRTGRSYGCLGIDPLQIHKLLDELQGGSLVYNYTGN